MKRLSWLGLVFLFLACSEPSPEKKEMSAKPEKESSPLPKMISTQDSALKTFSMNGFDFQVFQDSPGHVNLDIYKGLLTPEERLAAVAGDSLLQSLNVLLVRGQGKLLLIDAGWGTGTAVKGNTPALLRAQGILPEAIDEVLLTHMHGDHVTGLLDSAGKAAYPKAVLRVAKPELDFWLSEAAAKRALSNKELAERVAKAYEGRIQTFAFGDTLLPGLVVTDAVGHTPGHTAFFFPGSPRALLVAGDFLHAAALQFAYPDEYPSYDMDPVQAVITRKFILNRAVNDSLLVMGAHIPFPGVGTVERVNANSYRFNPLP
ncbi:MAG: MBL fold metallo-hydrolase [Fibrobacter sp.]|nr:MBL fold metallo-hydrolase [Fibrobacter sp.]